MVLLPLTWGSMAAQGIFAYLARSANQLMDLCRALLQRSSMRSIHRQARLTLSRYSCAKQQQHRDLGADTLHCDVQGSQCLDIILPLDLC